MTRGGRRLVVAVAVLLLVAVVVASSAALAVVALPLALALGLAIAALVGGRGRRVRRGPGSTRTGTSARLPGVEHGADPPGLRWVTHWESVPPPDAVPLSRDRLAVVLAEWGLAGEATEPALLVVTELLSNAIDHGRGPVGLAIEYAGESVHVEVHDGSRDAPQLQPHDLQRSRGRGLQLVEALSVRWGWNEDPPGKVVWADVPTGWPTLP